jgi:hypothetical protein
LSIFEESKKADMKRTLLLLLLLCSVEWVRAQNIFWCELSDSEKAVVLSQPRISETIKAFYFGHRSAGDFISEDALMGTLSKADSNQLPFYFEVFRSRMPAYRDSIDRASFTVHVLNMLYYHPAYVAEYLRKHDDTATRQLFRDAVQYAFEELPFLYPDKAEFHRQLLKRAGPPNKTLIEELLE